jgi:Zn-dependent M28 family amino/carboxypeptidase
VNRDTYQNVVGRFGPQAGDLIIIGAHYDACEEYPGADDNASGVAGLLELARMFQEKPPTVPVELVAYSTEEPPYFRTILMGSVVHAKSLSIDTQPIQFMISLEMIGYFSDERGSQKYPMDLLKLFYPSRGNFIAIVSNMESTGLVRTIKRQMAEASPLPIRSINGPSWIPGIDYSDHRNYWPQGIPALMITDTSFYRNPHYHQPTDTADRLDYTRMAQVIDGVFNTLQ